jgi:CRISPR-associated Cas5-like protein
LSQIRLIECEDVERLGSFKMKTYTISLEISGPTAMWTRPDTGDAPFSYLAPTYSAANGILESVCWLKSAQLRTELHR